jgi:hypothetical protein
MLIIAIARGELEILKEKKLEFKQLIGLENSDSAINLI